MEKYLADCDELESFYQHDSNRAVAVVWPAIVENRLTDLLRLALVPEPKEFRELFDPGKAIGNFGTKIRLAYLCGLIDKSTCNDLRLLAKIRNKFAHEVNVKDFEEEPIKNWLDSMNIIQENKGLLLGFAKNNQGLSAAAYVLENELSDYRNMFHFCVRRLIQKTVAQQKSLETMA